MNTDPCLSVFICGCICAVYADENTCQFATDFGGSTTNFTKTQLQRNVLAISGRSALWFETKKKGRMIMSREKTDRRDFLKQAAVLGLALGAPGKVIHPDPEPKGADPEWRNKQPGMAYRRLGRTGIMVSEVVSG